MNSRISSPTSDEIVESIVLISLAVWRVVSWWFFKVWSWARIIKLRACLHYPLNNNLLLTDTDEFIRAFNYSEFVELTIIIIYCDTAAKSLSIFLCVFFQFFYFSVFLLLLWLSLIKQWPVFLVCFRDRNLCRFMVWCTRFFISNSVA